MARLLKILAILLSVTCNLRWNAGYVELKNDNCMKNQFFISILFIAFTIINSNAQSISELYKKWSPAVVVIEADELIETADGQTSFDASLGSGVLIDTTGHILTAAHVVNHAVNITVKFISGEKVPAEMVRTSTVADVALIKLRWMPDEYTIAQIADSDFVEIGEEIAIIGAPYGLEYSLSRGIISGRTEERTRTNGFTFAEFFQTDAAINQGNSGGPMFNMDGEVIGIVSYIITESGGFQGLGFAATSNVCRRMVINNKRRYLGINGFVLTAEHCALLNVPQKRALLIQNVVNLSPADLAGLKGGKIPVSILGDHLQLGGDIILAINDIPIDSEDNFIRILFSFREADNRDSFKVKLLREGAILEKKVSLRR